MDNDFWKTKAVVISANSQSQISRISQIHDRFVFFLLSSDVKFKIPSSSWNLHRCWSASELMMENPLATCQWVQIPYIWCTLTSIIRNHQRPSILIGVLSLVLHTLLQWYINIIQTFSSKWPFSSEPSFFFLVSFAFSFNSHFALCPHFLSTLTKCFPVQVILPGIVLSWLFLCLTHYSLHSLIFIIPSL